MMLSEKIRLLRKTNGYSQEQLAEACNVSRQAISKWEADMALPETEKLLIISRLFGTAVDVLLKDELQISGIKEVSTCGKTSSKIPSDGIYRGVIIKESILDENILDHIVINNVEIWKTVGKPKYWTVLFFTSNYIDLPECLSKTLASNENDEGNWFADMKIDNTKLIIFKDKVLKYEIGNSMQKAQVHAECSKLGISNNQMNWEE